MNAAWLLLGLLIIGAIGNRIRKGGRLRGFGLPSGSESLLFGLFLGPHGLGLVHTSDLQSFSPVVLSAVGWLAFVVGTRLAEPASDQNLLRHDASLMPMLLGGALAALCLMAVTISAYFALNWLHVPARSTRWLMGSALGLVMAGSAQQLIDWARQRYGAAGRTTDGLQSASIGGDAFALLAMAPLVAFDFTGKVSALHMAIVSLMPIFLGALLGIAVRLLLRFERREAERWALLLGSMLFIVGLAQRLGASIVTGAFVAGWVLGRGNSSNVREMRTLIAPAESSVLLPVLVIAGATVDLREIGNLGIVTALVVLMRLAVELVAGSLVVAIVARRLRPILGAGMALASSGEVAVIVAMAYAVVHPGRFGQTVLLTAIVAALVGELVAPGSLRRLLRDVNELSLESPSSQPPASPSNRSAA